jgi:hypothetical protein
LELSLPIVIVLYAEAEYLSADVVAVGLDEGSYRLAYLLRRCIRLPSIEILLTHGLLLAREGELLPFVEIVVLHFSDDFGPALNRGEAVIDVSCKYEVSVCVVDFEFATVGELPLVLAVIEMVAFCDYVESLPRTRHLGIGVEPSHDIECLVRESAIYLDVVEVEPDEGTTLVEAKSANTSNTLWCLGLHEDGFRASLEVPTQRRYLTVTHTRRLPVSVQFETMLVLPSKSRTRLHQRQKTSNIGRGLNRYLSPSIDVRRTVAQQRTFGELSRATNSHSTALTILRTRVAASNRARKNPILQAVSNHLTGRTGGNPLPEIG